MYTYTGVGKLKSRQYDSWPQERLIRACRNRVYSTLGGSNKQNMHIHISTLQVQITTLRELRRSAGGWFVYKLNFSREMDGWWRGGTFSQTRGSLMVHVCTCMYSSLEIFSLAKHVYEQRGIDLLLYFVVSQLKMLESCSCGVHTLEEACFDRTNHQIWLVPKKSQKCVWRSINLNIIRLKAMRK